MLKKGGNEAACGEMEALIIRRLCLIQLASFQREETSDGGQMITLKFPLDYPELP